MRLTYFHTINQVFGVVSVNIFKLLYFCKEGKKYGCCKSYCPENVGGGFSNVLQGDTGMQNDCLIQIRKYKMSIFLRYDKYIFVYIVVFLNYIYISKYSD